MTKRESPETTQQDDDIAEWLADTLQCRREELLDISQEGGAGHGSVKGHWGGDSRQPERTDERRGFPVPVRNWCATPLTTQGSAAQAGHLGRYAGLINENQSRGIKVWLVIKPNLTLCLYVRPFLLTGVRSLFLNVTPCRAKKRSTELFDVSKPKAWRK